MRISDWSADVCSSDLEIRRTLGDDCRVWLSFGSTCWLKRCKEGDDEFFVERLAGGFTLYRASRDEPRLRRGSAGETAPCDSGSWEVRSVGQECVLTGKSRVSPYHAQKTKTHLI